MHNGDVPAGTESTQYLLFLVGRSFAHNLHSLVTMCGQNNVVEQFGSTVDRQDDCAVFARDQTCDFGFEMYPLFRKVFQNRIDILLWWFHIKRTRVIAGKSSEHLSGLVLQTAAVIGIR